MTPIADIIINETKQVISNKGEQVPEITFSSEFLAELPMDSLDLATLIVTLEMATGIDPFKDGFKTFHNVGELIALYEGASS